MKDLNLTAAPTVKLPRPQLEGGHSLEIALATRRSVRAFKDEPLSIGVLAQLAWAAQGVTLKMDAPPGWNGGTWQGGKRTAPSAGAMYPLTLHLVARKIDGLKAGVYRYHPLRHELLLVCEGEKKNELTAAARNKEWVGSAPLVFIVSATHLQMQIRFGERSPRYIHFEVGHAVENICLQAAALGMGTTVVGAFADEEVKKLVGMAEEEQPLLLVPVGKVQ